MAHLEAGSAAGALSRSGSPANASEEAPTSGTVAGLLRMYAYLPLAAVDAAAAC